MARPNADLPQSAAAGAVMVDPYRAFIFPNHIRERRRDAGYDTLMDLAHALPDIPYIRLSKIERGEAVARAEELRLIADALDLPPTELLIDVDAPDFAIAEWARPFLQGRQLDVGAARFAVMVGAAVRARRHADPDLTIAAIARDHGLPPVILSRVETAQRPFEEWNEPTRAAVMALLGVSDAQALAQHVTAQLDKGELAPFLATLGDPAVRLARTRDRIAALRSELAAPAAPPASPALDEAIVVTDRRVAILGVAGSDGLVVPQDTGEAIVVPPDLGPKVIALRVCRATLGGGLPGQSIVFIDPDRYPVAGGLAAVREGGGYRLLAVAVDRTGRLSGYSVAPDREVVLDSLPPGEAAAIVAARFII
ncbi:MAG: helix-turn-helix domain-containing protein [Sphingomonas sp.]